MPTYATLTLHEAGLLADILRGVQSNAKIDWYPTGADGPHAQQVMRAITDLRGNFLPRNADVRDGYVWTSGISEMFLPVPLVMAAVDNMAGGDPDKPLALINPA